LPRQRNEPTALTLRENLRQATAPTAIRVLSHSRYEGCCSTGGRTRNSTGRPYRYSLHTIVRIATSRRMEKRSTESAANSSAHLFTATSRQPRDRLSLRREGHRLALVRAWM